MIVFIHPLTGSETYVSGERAREYEALGYVRRDTKKHEPVSVAKPKRPARKR